MKQDALARHEGSSVNVEGTNQSDHSGAKSVTSLAFILNVCVCTCIVNLELTCEHPRALFKMPLH